MSGDLTMQEAIADNMIALVNAADGMDQSSFARLLESVALRLASEGKKRRSGRVNLSTTEFLREGFCSHSKQVRTDDHSHFPSP
ncbi:hypothetical protein GGQ64_004978 [Rhizobium azooxidifex]|uniref:Transposase n=1 Tax=Mycoplana azooxidifex TaxID=1636188 RepID=A0A7W6DAP6_9HYPH|nr:hypothetical protein [Mycoplana azooxidifex]MBB3979733.1 hypothetical protein [Mycoplana azooxidifex]